MNNIEGLSNFRDLGGLQLIHGGNTQYARLLRSDSLKLLSETGKRQLRQIPVSNIIDLRSPFELSRDPEVEIPGVAIDTIPLLAGETESIMRAAISAKDETRLQNLLYTMYVSMLEHEGLAIAKAIDVTARSLSQGNGAELVHCTAGKDRTGILVALILSVAGVQRKAILEDYVATQKNLSGAWFDRMMQGLQSQGIILDENLQQLLILSPVEVMNMLLEHIDQQYESVNGYLKAQGVEDSTLRVVKTGMTQL